MSSETLLLTGLITLIGNEKPFAWAKRIGIPGPTFDRVWHHGGQLKSEHLALISRKTGVSIDWLLTGQGSMYISAFDGVGAGQGTGFQEGCIGRTPRLPDEAQPVFEAFVEVMTSKENGTILALTQNTYEFRDKIRLQKELAVMKEDMDAIKRRLFDEPRETDFKTQEAPGASEHPGEKHRAGGK
jgi:hypothetical protein